MGLCILGLWTVTSCELVWRCQRTGGPSCPLFSVELPPLLLTQVLIPSALQPCFTNIISPSDFSTEILCSFPLSCCSLLFILWRLFYDMVYIVSFWWFWSMLKEVIYTVACVNCYPSICLGSSTWKLGQDGSFWVRNWMWNLPDSKLRITRPRFTIYGLINIWVIIWLSSFLLRCHLFWNILCTGLHDDCLG